MTRVPLSPDRPIFVVGHPRSGTTLLASMLGRHPAIASTPESLFLTQVRFELGPVLGGGPEAIADRIEATPLRFVAGARHRLLEALREVEPTERNVFGVLLELFREDRGRERVLEKSPLHLRHIDDLLRWFPDAKIVWIVRDGRACVSSLLRVPWASGDPKVLARQWIRNMAFGEFAAAPASSLRQVRYEALVRDPIVEMRGILEFLEVEPSDAVHEHTREVETVKPGEREWKQNIGKPLLGFRAEAWREELKRETLEQLSWIMGPTLRRFGYDPGPQPERIGASNAFERVRSTLVCSRASIAMMRLGFPPAMRAMEYWKPRAQRKRRYWRVPADTGPGAESR